MTRNAWKTRILAILQPIQQHAPAVSMHQILLRVMKAACVKIFLGSQVALALMTRNAWKTQILAILQQIQQHAPAVTMRQILLRVMKAACVKIFLVSQVALALMTRNAWETRILAILQQIQQHAPAVTMRQILLRVMKADTACQLCQDILHAPALMQPSV